jgi:hypothetical protein
VSTALGLAARELAHLRRDNAELRQLVPPKPPALSELRDGQEVTMEQLAALKSAQHAGTLRHRPGEQREVYVTDRVGRRIRHFFGDPAVTWDCFSGAHKRVTGFNTKV